MDPDGSGCEATIEIYHMLCCMLCHRVICLVFDYSLAINPNGQLVNGHANTGSFTVIVAQLVNYTGLPLVG